jgi:hypothetical protein
MGEGYKGYEGYAIPPGYEWRVIYMNTVISIWMLTANHTLPLI